MLQNTDISRVRWDNAAPASKDQASDCLRSLVGGLEQLGFEVPPLYGTQNDVAGGVPMRLAVRDLLRSASGTGIATSTILTLLKDGVPLTLSLTDLGNESVAVSNLQRFCEVLQAEIGKYNAGSSSIGVCVHSHQLPLQAFQVITKSVLGNGPRYVFLDSLQMTQHSNPRVQSETDQNWRFLWRNRMASAPLKPAYGASVRTACPLLADEVAASVLPVSGIQVPVDSAWLPLGLQLPQFANETGEIGWEQLLPALASGVELAEKILDRLRWLHPGHATDAHLNRRLALSITGLGELVMRRGLDPADLATLRWLSSIIGRIRVSLWHRSGQLVQENGCLPALCGSDPSSGWHDSAHRENWRRRWRAALEKSAVRHRNLLVLSPYSVLPTTIAGDASYTDLLPVIAYADAWSFAETPEFRGWNLNEYKVFHRRAWAVIQGGKSGTLIAAGV